MILILISISSLKIQIVDIALVLLQIHVIA